MGVHVNLEEDQIEDPEEDRLEDGHLAHLEEVHLEEEYPLDLLFD